MKIKSIYKFLFVLLAFVIMLQACGAPGGNDFGEQSSETEEQIRETETESCASDDTDIATEATESIGSLDAETADTTESTTEKADSSDTETENTAETEEETEVITDKAVGETLEAEYAADFSVSRAFSDDMVVQRNEHIRIWGFAPESENGKKVSGSFKGMFAETIIENGEWTLTFTARLEADTAGAEMKIYTDKKTVTFKNVLVGDVYMVIGQSNTQYSVSSHISNTDAATQGGGKSAIDPNSIIRLNMTSTSSGGSYPKKGTDFVYRDVLNTKQWTKTTEADTLGFSAVGYYFAKELTERTENKIPVGVIEIGFSGAPLGAFLPNALAELYNTDDLNPTTGKYITTGVNAATFPGRSVYNCHMAPFEKYAIAGVVWYQGESNNSADEAMKYNELFSALMTYMRGTHNVVNKDFPVFIVEFPSIYKKPASFTGTWHFMELGIIRSYMGAIPSVLKNSYIAVSGDLWGDRAFFNSLHPNCKFEQAGRLASLAEAVIYENLPLAEAAGPYFESVAISEDKKTATVTLANVGDGLKTSDGGNAVKGIVGFVHDTFSVSKTCAPTSAKIVGKDKIEVTFTEEIKAVAYGYQSEDYYGESINLCNSAGIPAAAFMTPFKDREIPTIKAEDFVPFAYKALGKKGKAVDTLTVDGQAIFSTGGIESKLAQAGNKATILAGSSTLNTYGWVGFSREIILFGYSIDGGDAIFKSNPGAAAQAVLDAGGKYAKRFSININVKGLSVGKHSVDVLALVDYNGGTAAKLFSFTLVVEEAPKAPEGVQLPNMDTGEYGFLKCAHDQITVDNVQIYVASAHVKIAAAGNVLKVKKGSKTLTLSGWAGFETKIDRFGYAIDGEIDLLMTPAAPNDAIIAAGGENAMRYAWNADISSLSVGLHTVDVLVSIYLGEGTATLVMYSFTLEITES